ncbi:MAG: hypothetical protein PWP67_1534 [Clostridium butyricum]|uniref:AraC family transcriptional regulator n=1 Tax=Clostridium butyricum TaxID=1492 RepID=UPI0028FD5BDA|nr:AraC family transcriptional regulator [Clostridium butyricum]MDK2828725.1 hypothetical protein [Clostridium butyricum]MDU0321168.1 AraC family transcriptional regulator [Clostridium butyricum]
MAYHKYLRFVSSFSQKNKTLELVYTPSDFAVKNLYYVMFIDDIYIQESFSYSMENTNSYCIIYTLSGEGILKYNNIIYKLKPNSLCFLDCKVYHTIKNPENSCWHFQVLFINGHNIPPFFNSFAINESVTYNIPATSNAINLITLLLKYCNSLSDYYEFIISNLLNNLLTCMIIDKNKSLNIPNCMPKYIKDIQSLFDNNYSESYTLNELSHMYNINKYKLVRDFTKYISKSPIEYLITKRINAAQNLLISTTLPIHEISSSIGINNVNHFINLFKKHTGLSPLNYRKSYS